MKPPRRPVSFPVTPVEEPPVRIEQRRPRAIDDLSAIQATEFDIFDEPDVVTAPPPPATPIRHRHRVAAIFLTAFGLFLSLAIGLWVDSIVRSLFARYDWLGWFALALALVAALALVFLLARELIALRRLKSIEAVRTRIADALHSGDTKRARAAVDEVASIIAARPETAAGRRALDALRGEIIDGPDLIRLAERDLLAPLDARAQVMILDAAKRVSLVTAVSPRALVDLAYVIFEAGRLIRRMAELYGGRPGTLGFLRIARNVLAHLAITGTVAFGDSLVQQLIGQGLAARLSARLGEGVVNGMMTARIGIAAMETARPMPFQAQRRPGLGAFLSALTAFTRERATADTADRPT